MPAASDYSLEGLLVKNGFLSSETALYLRLEEEPSERRSLRCFGGMMEVPINDCFKKYYLLPKLLLTILN